MKMVWCFEERERSSKERKIALDETEMEREAVSGIRGS